MGLAKRLVNPPSDAEKKAQKAAYDAEYRARNNARLKARKSAYYQRTHDPVREAEIRKRNMPRHVAYCQRPEYRVKKAVYDRQHLAHKAFGEFAEAALLLQNVEKEIASRATRYEIYQMNGTLNKAQTRRRAL